MDVITNTSIQEAAAETSIQEAAAEAMRRDFNAMTADTDHEVEIDLTRCDEQFPHRTLSMSRSLLCDAYNATGLRFRDFLAVKSCARTLASVHPLRARQYFSGIIYTLYAIGGLCVIRLYKTDASQKMIVVVETIINKTTLSDDEFMTICAGVLGRLFIRSGPIFGALVHPVPDKELFWKTGYKIINAGKPSARIKPLSKSLKDLVDKT